MSRYSSYILILFFGLLLYSCVPVYEEVITDIDLQTDDSTLHKIFDFQDKAMVDSLYSYFTHANPGYRYASAMAFASIQDSNALVELRPLLKDPNVDVRCATAYAIGQIKHPGGEALLINNFERDDTIHQWDLYHQSLLEAVGKCGTAQSLGFISDIKSYGLKDTLLLKGQAQSIYRFALRDITSPDGTQKMVDFLDVDNVPPVVMLYAAQYLSRAKYTTLSKENQQVLIRRINNSESGTVKSALAMALGKTKSDIALQELMGLYDRERNPLVQCNIIRALKNFSYATVQSVIFKALRSNQVQVAQSAAEFFISNGESTDGSVYYRMSRDSLNPLVRMTLLRAANKYVSPIYEEQNLLVNNVLKGTFQDTTNSVYERAYALKGLAEYGWNYKYINRNGFGNKEAVIRTASMEALGIIASDPNFNRNFGLGRTKVKKELSQFIASAINGTDPAMKAVAAGILADSTLQFLSQYDNSSFLHVAKRGLSLPQETETLYALQQAINTFDKTSTTLPAPAYNHPIDWDFYQGLSNTPQVRIETKKGDIILDLYPLQAPGSVVNFLKLVKDGFFDGKSYHRMVPNFVVQAGCTRGDGYGGLDYTIRSEVGQNYYDEGGYLGMASAGLHTEGTQWFITHAASPHLDGRYTIFGKVNQGLEVVQNIQVGDIIETIKILN